MQSATKQQGQILTTPAGASPQEKGPSKPTVAPPPIKAWSAEDYTDRIFQLNQQLETTKPTVLFRRGGLSNFQQKRKILL
jgi:hypothetical protein